MVLRRLLALLLLLKRNDDSGEPRAEPFLEPGFDPTVRKGKGIDALVDRYIITGMLTLVTYQRWRLQRLTWLSP